MYLNSLEMVYNPHTGEPLDFYFAEDSVILPVTIDIPDPWSPFNLCTIEGMDFMYLFGIHKYPFERMKMIGRLGDQDWSIEYLAAHLDAARTPQLTSVEWPAHVSRTDKESEDALRLMVAYHYNMNNLTGWNKPESEAYEAGTQVIEWMPSVSLLITPNDGGYSR